MKGARGQGILWLAIVLGWCACAFALDPSLDISQYAHTAWKVRDGFTKGPINCVAQTRDGYLWLGTAFGLVRFDGARAVPWQPPPGEKLPNDNIEALFTAKDGTLWIGTFRGLASWNGENLTVYPELAGQGVFRLLQDREGTIWVGGIATPNPGRLCAIRAGSIQCHGQDGTFGIGVFGLYEDIKGNLWVGVVNGLWRWKPGVSQFFPMQAAVNDLGEDDGGSLLIASPTGISRFADGRIESYQPSQMPRFFGYKILRDRDGALWIATTDRGLVHLHKGKADVFSAGDGISNEFVLNLFEDREGTIWAASAGGLDRFREYAIPNVSAKQGLSHRDIHSVLATDDSSVLIATASGLNRWKDGRVSVYGSREVNAQSDGKLNGQNADSLFEDGEGKIWVSTPREFGSLENERFVPIRDLRSGYVHDVIEVGEEHLWLADQRAGLIHLFRGKVVQQIPWAGLDHTDMAMTLAADPSGKGFWLGFYEGGVAYFAEAGIQKSYSQLQGLGQGQVSGLRFDSGGALWAATQGGLSRIKDDRVATLGTKNGLPCDAVHWSEEDDNHSVWLYMPCGVVRIAQSELDAWVVNPTRVVRVTTFDASDGVPSGALPCVFTRRVAKSSDGMLWFASQDGVGVIDPHNLHENKLAPPVHIEKIVADDKTYDEPGNGVRLATGVRYVTIDYTALSLVVPEKVHFRYKLEGQDKDWREVVNDREVQYSNLAPKRYRFRVLASNNSGVWNEEGAAVEFVIPPAWYQTSWFYAGCVAAFLAMVWGVYELRVRQLAAEFNVRLEERLAERTRIARDLHDTLLQSFQGLVLRFQAARYQLPERPVEASETLDSALTAADQAIAEGRGAIQELRSGASEESDLEQMLLALGSELAASQDGEGGAPLLRVIVEGSRRAKPAIIRQEIYRIARELVRNAYKHAHARNIEAELRYDDDAFLLLVRDDGKGIDANILKERGRAGHWGLPGIYERAEGIGARLDIWSEGGAGTEVRLTVPAAVAYKKSRDSGKFRLFRKTRIYEHRS